MSQENLVFNPYLPFWEYVPDGEPHVFEGRLWVYGSHDRRDGTEYCQEDYVVWSAPVDDLSRWECGGTIFKRTDDPRHPDGDANLAAPDVARGPDGRYYLYYFNDMQGIGVAVAETPAGPFSFLGYVAMPDGGPLGAGVPFDPGVLVDETGIWLYYGIDQSKFMGEDLIPVSGSYCVQLEDDMLTCAGEPVKVLGGVHETAGTPFEGHAFFEASSPRRIGDRYYLVYSSQQGHELCYAVSDRPDGGFSYGGTIVSFVNLGYHGNAEPEAYPGNTHGGLVCVEGQWYVFYHRHTHKLQFSRQGCAEQIQILPDGSIPQVEATSCGLNGGPLPSGERYPAHIACGLKGPEGVVHISSHVHRRPSDPYFWQEGGPDDGCMYAGNLQDGAALTFKYLALSGAETLCELTCRGAFEGEVEVRTVAAEDGAQTVVGTVPVAASEEWTAHTGAVSIPSGTWGVRFMPHGQGVLDLKDFRIG